MNPTADILAHLDEIEALAAKATEGPWTDRPRCLSIINTEHIPAHVVRQSRDNQGRRKTSYVAQCHGQGCENNGDASFIAASRDGWPATVKALRGLAEHVQSEIDRLDSDEQKCIAAGVLSHPMDCPVRNSHRASLAAAASVIHRAQ